MESFEKMSIPALLAVMLCACGTPPEPVIIIQDPLVLQEIAPLPKALVVKPPVEYEAVYAVLRIVEVSEVNGIQKFFLARAGQDKKNFAVGGEGEIGTDAEFGKVIGAYKIIETYDEFFRCEILRLDYKIGASAYIRIKTGERVKQ